jgi:DNA-binding CsgD family transcriptional regulator
MRDLGKTDFFINPLATGNRAFHSKFSRIIDACEDSNNLIIAIYLIEEDRFLYCNNAFKKIAGKNYDLFLEGGWNTWFRHISPEESLLIKTRVESFLAPPHHNNAITFRYHIVNCIRETVLIKHEIVLNTVEKFTLALNYFFDVSGKEQIEQCLNGGKRYCLSTGTNNYVTSISPREEQVLKLIADGYSSKQIADKLYISNHTAISHRKHLIEKFRVKNTAQLIKKASKVMDL